MIKKKNKTLKICIILIIAIIILILVIDKKSFNNYDDITIFDIWEKVIKIKEKDENIYKFDLRNVTMQFGKIDLKQSVNAKSLVKEKIAPGTYGKFYIKVKTNPNTNIKYKIEIVPINEKPQYLYFNIKDTDIKFFNIEELNTYLKGYMKPNTMITIPIEWKWEYENNKLSQDEDDTISGMNAQKFEFSIKVFAYEDK